MNIYEFGNYVKSCLLTDNINEFSFVNNVNEKYFNDLVQDAIIITKTIDKNLIKKCETLAFDDHIIIRKNQKNIVWYDENTGEINFDNSTIPLYRRLLPPPYETVNHCYIISLFAKTIKSNNNYCNYLEYGVRTGESFNNVSKYCDNSFGVDIVPF